MGLDLLARKVVLSPFLAGGALGVLLVAGPVTAGVEATSLAPGPALGQREKVRERSVVAYSFHGTLRCTTCLLVEQNADEAIRGNFADELLDGSLAWRSVNIRLPENRHFATEYEVFSWALVLVDYRGGTPGKWRSLPLAGELVHADPGNFRRYVTGEVRAFLEDNQPLTGSVK